MLRLQNIKNTPQETAAADLAAQLDAVARGDKNAFALLYERTSAKLFGVCLRILSERSEAEDVLQETYITIWHRAGAFDASRASAITWLATVARNKAIDRLRASGRTRQSLPIEAADDVADGAQSALLHMEQQEDNKRLYICLDQLPGNSRQAVRKAFLHGATYQELAEKMSVPLGTMKSWIRRGLINLRACLENDRA